MHVRSRVPATGVVVLFAAGAARMLTAQQPVSALRPVSSLQLPPVQLPASAPVLVFDHVTVVDVEHGRLRPDQRVVIVGNRIQAVGRRSAVALPLGAQVVEAGGRYLIPGLWDLHVHGGVRVYPLYVMMGVTGIRSASSSVPLDTLRQWRREILAGRRVGPPRQILSGPELNGGYGRCGKQPYRGCVEDAVRAQQVVDSLHAAGVDMIKTYNLSAPMYFAVAAAARRHGLPFGGHLVKAPVLAASDSGVRILDHLWGATTQDPEHPGQQEDHSGGLAALCYGPRATVASCEPVAERLRRNDTWLVPTVIPIDLAHADRSLGWRSRAVYEASVRRVKDRMQTLEMLQQSRLFRGSGNWLRDSTHLSLAAAGRTRDSIVKGDSLDWATYDSVVNAGVRMRHAQPSRPDPQARRDGLLAIIERVGLPIAAGTDDAVGTFYGWGLHVELAMMVAEGVSPLHALQSATLNPAKLWHSTDSLGTVAPGKLADLVLLEANPLADITNTTTIRAVVANGRYFDRAALDTLLAEAR